MHVKIVTLFALFCVGRSHDVSIGTETQGRKIFDETRQANPAIWRQYENVTVIAPENELIGKVVITDMRPEKDGDVEIVDGGDGKKFVTIELKSPTVLRGYEFRIEVYSVPETMYTDAEEHLPREQITASPIDTGMTTELNDKANSGDITATDDMSSNSGVDISAPPQDQNESTDSSEASVNVPAVDATDLKDNSFRPARETPVHTSVISSDSTETSGDGTTEILPEDVSTTEADITTASYEQSTPAPISFDNSKNIPDYNSLSILDYIKNKEAVRPIRHTVDNNNSESSEQPDHTDENIDTTPLAEDSSSLKPTDDDTVDLVPPEVDASYNSEFTTNSETTENPADVSTLKEYIPREGRGIDFDGTTVTEEYSTPISTSTVEVTTATLEGKDDNLSITSIEDEQSRNTRHTGKELDENSNEDSTSDEKRQFSCVPSETGVSCVNALDIQSNGNVIKFNLESLLPRDDNKRVIYALPIVLIIDSENDLPIIKIEAEDPSTEREYKALYPMQPMDQASDESLDTSYDNEATESDGVANKDFMRADAERSQRHLI